jgi:N-acetyl-gamma-glutamyl-phosphate reductase
MLYPSLAAAYPNLVFEEYSPERFIGLDVVFLGIPHEAALEIAPQLFGKVGCLIDLSAAYRLKDASLYPRWYGFTHTQPELLSQAVYGLPELYRSQLAGARLIATPGCYVTAASLALTPLVRAGIISGDGVIVDAASGVSGAGRALKHSSLFSTVDEDFTAYGLLDHRHTPEIEQVTGAQVLFTPHLAPMNRGILATCYARPASKDVTTASLLAALATFYKDEHFVVVRPTSPSTKATLGSNSVHITARFDERTGYVMVIAALDNIAKGASGGAVQSMNAALGLQENLGLSNVGVYP